MSRPIDADALYERACSLEAQALDYVGKLIERDGDKVSVEWRIWSAILTERTAFKHDVFDAPTIEPKPQWIPCSVRLPELRDWYLGIFKEPDTGWINPIPFICDYLLGKKTKATTKEGWILKGFTDREEYIDYYFNLECVAWMTLSEPYQGEG